MTATFVLADIHGRFDLLERALRLIQSGASGGTVIFLGDYVDRGPQSREVVERLMAGPPPRWNWITLKGNHEDLMVNYHDEPVRQNAWIDNGGDKTLSSYGGLIPPEHIDWARDLPSKFIDTYRVYAHAGIDPARPLDQQAEETLLWKRYPARAADIHYPGYHIVHGHTPQRFGPECYPGRTNLDTGAVFFGRLVVGRFDDDLPGGPVELLEVTELTQRRSPKST